MISFDRDICTNFEQSTRREWLETNGIGGFASSTVSGANTRRYHGLLTAATQPPLGRITMLSKFEETLIINAKKYELSTNQFPETVYPTGYKFLKNFRLNPFPIWTFEIEGIEIIKKVFMVYGSNATVVEFKIENSKFKIELELKPLLSFSDYHHLQRENSDFDLHYETGETLVKVKPLQDIRRFIFAHTLFSVVKTNLWYRNYEYAVERARGFDFMKICFSRSR
jgi:predicted glycogen debranching enzyme